MSTHRFDGFTKIDSDHMDGVRYDPLNRKMTVRYKNGYIYEVHGVESETYQEFLDAPSQGEHYHAFIKNQHRVERVR
jgi:KTSC domain